MKDLQTTDLKKKVINSLLSGVNPDTTSKEHDCELSYVMEIMGSGDFQEQISEHLRKEVRIQGVSAIRNIKKIADDDKNNANTRLRANQWIAEKALEINELGTFDASASTMTQDQLARKLKELQAEAVKRAKPIETGVIDNQSSDDLSDMID